MSAPTNSRKTVETDRAEADAINRGTYGWKHARLMEAQRDEARDALAAFSHPDLCTAHAGNIEGDKSIVFQRNAAFITLGDFRKARALLTPKPTP